MQAGLDLRDVQDESDQTNWALPILVFLLVLVGLVLVGLGFSSSVYQQEVMQLPGTFTGETEDDLERFVADVLGLGYDDVVLDDVEGPRACESPCRILSGVVGGSHAVVFVDPDGVVTVNATESLGLEEQD